PVVASIIAAPLVALVAGAVVVPLAITRRHEVAVAIAIDHDRLGVADRALIVAALVYVHRHRAPVTRGLLPVAEVPVVVVDHDDAARLGWNVVGTADPDRTDVDRGRDLGCSRLGEQQGQERNRGKDGAAHWVPPSRERVNHARDEASTVPIFNWLEFNDLRNSRGSRCPPSWTLVTRIGRAPVVTWCVAKVTSSPEQ